MATDPSSALLPGRPRANPATTSGPDGYTQCRENYNQDDCERDEDGCSWVNVLFLSQIFEIQ